MHGWAEWQAELHGKMAVLEIDGSFGEGGGQVLRSSVALSMVTGTPIQVRRIRAGRHRPGLARQHLTAVEAAAAICGATVRGARLGSTGIDFEPGKVAAGHYRFAVGTAGSTTLVLQCVLPALLTAPGPSSLVLEGGTHNPLAPPFPFLAGTFLPLVRRMGPRVTAVLERPGFHPAGGGRIRVDVEPSPLRGFELTERGEVRARRATAILARLPRHVGERELRQVQRILGWPDSALRLQEIGDAAGPGNALVLEIESETLTETFVGFGRPGIRAEKVAKQAAAEARRYLRAEVPVGENLADQIVLPLALAGGGAFATLPLSRHTTTQIELVRRFLDVPIRVEDASGRTDVRIG